VVDLIQVLIGWVREERDVGSHGEPYGWAGAQTLPRQVRPVIRGGETIESSVCGVASLKLCRECGTSDELGSEDGAL
jgi:hypothetical protein